jgi:hypothetical protein
MAQIDPYKKQGELEAERKRADKYLLENAHMAKNGVYKVENGVTMDEQRLGQTGVQVWQEEKSRINKAIKKLGAATPTVDYGRYGKK